MEEWLTFDGQRFSFTTTISRGHGLAEHLCRQNNSHLVEITSREQEEFIDSVIDTHNVSQKTNCLWIGLQNSTGEWTWPSGEKLEYHNWEPGEPNLLETQRCVNKHITGTYKLRKTWFNEYCDRGGQRCGRICQKPVDTTSAVIEFTNTISNTASEVTSASTPTAINRTEGQTFPAAAVAIPVVLLILILALVLFYLYRKRRGSKPKGDVAVKSEAGSSPNRARTENSNGAWHDLGEVEGVESWDNDRDSFVNSGPEFEEDEVPNASTGDVAAGIEV